MNLDRSFSEASNATAAVVEHGTLAALAPCAKSDLQASEQVGEALGTPLPCLEREEVSMAIVDSINQEETFWDGLTTMPIEAALLDEGIIFRTEQDLYFCIELVFGWKVLQTFECTLTEALAKAREQRFKRLAVCDAWGRTIEEYPV